VDFCRVGGNISRGPRLEVIAEVRASLVADFLGRRFPAVLGDARVVVDAHAANVQLRAAFRAFVQSAQRQAQGCQRSAAFPADQIVCHGGSLRPPALEITDLSGTGPSGARPSPAVYQTRT